MNVRSLIARARGFFLGRGPRFVGAVTVLVVVVLVGALFVPSGFALGKATYHAELPQAGGLTRGEEVRVAGVRVGNVRSVKVDHALVRVDFRIQRGIHLGRDTTAEVKVATLLGNHFLDVHPGGGGPLPHHTIPLANTTVPFLVQDVIEVGATALEALDGDKLRAALKVLADDFRGTTTLTGKTFDSIARLSEVVATRRGQLNELIHQANTVAANLDTNRDTLIDLLRQADLILAEIGKRREAISHLLTATRELAVQLTGLVRDNRATIGPLLNHLDTVLATLRANDKALEQIAVLLGPASRYFANTVGNGPYMDVNGPNAVFPDSMICAPQGKCVPKAGPKP